MEELKVDILSRKSPAVPLLHLVHHRKFGACDDAFSAVVFRSAFL